VARGAPLPIARLDQVEEPGQSGREAGGGKIGADPAWGLPKPNASVYLTTDRVMQSQLLPGADMPLHNAFSAWCQELTSAAMQELSIFSRHSITSSARTSSVGGTSRPRALAVLRLITSSYLVGACTGRSAGFSPLRMRST
jgi:hypothetical protein